MSKKYKKFALIGASCVGKTTLLFELKDKLEKQKVKVITVREAARYYFKRKKTRFPFSYINQRNIQALAKKFEQKEQTKEPEVLICDRSVFDAVAYLDAMGDKKNSQKLFKRMKRWLLTYDYLFLLDPKDIDYKTDSFRLENKKAQKKFHKSFVDLLKNTDFPYAIISGNRERRLKKALKIIKSITNE